MYTYQPKEPSTPQNIQPSPSEVKVYLTNSLPPQKHSQPNRHTIENTPQPPSFHHSIEKEKKSQFAEIRAHSVKKPAQQSSFRDEQYASGKEGE